jgi:hypothetical protein
MTFVVLMKGGGDPKIIDRWKKAAQRRLEYDLDRLAALRFFALTFAELIPQLLNWQQSLEGWQVRETQMSKNLKAEGELRGRRTALLQAAQRKLKSEAPEEVRLAIEGTNALDTLERWLDAVFEVDSWPDFEKRLKQP